MNDVPFIVILKFKQTLFSQTHKVRARAVADTRLSSDESAPAVLYEVLKKYIDLDLANLCNV